MSGTVRAPSGYALQAVVAAAQATLENLRTEHGQIVETDAEIADALTSEGVDIDEVLRRLTRCALDAKANAAAATERIGDLQQRRDRYRRHEEVLRATITQVLEALGLRAFVDPEFHLNLRDGALRVVITDADALPTRYQQVRTVVSPNTAAIKAAIDAGDTVAGAALSNGSAILQIRSK